MGRGAAGLLLTETPPGLRRLPIRVAAHLRETAIVATAAAGLLLLGGQLVYLSTLSQSFDYAERLRQGAIRPDYDLTTLPWQVARAAVFDLKPGALRLVTGDEPAAYQAYATVSTHGAAAADIQVEAEIESGSVTIGLLQAGRWIASSSSQRSGVFADSNSAHLGWHRSITVMIANNNPGGPSRLTLRSLRLFLRR